MNVLVFNINLRSPGLLFPIMFLLLVILIIIKLYGRMDTFNPLIILT